MANTTIPAGLVPKVIVQRAWKESQKLFFFKNMMSEKGDNIIQVNRDLTKKKGDNITFQLIRNLSGSGISGNSTLDGNEEAINLYPFLITVDQIRNAVQFLGLEPNRTEVDIFQEAEPLLTKWMADYQENTIVTKLTASPTADHVAFGGTCTAEDQLAVTDKLTVAKVSALRRKAMASSPRINPIKVDGQDLFVMLVSPNSYRDLKTDSAFTSAAYYAYERGLKNPLFIGASCILDNVIIYEYERISTTASGSSSAPVAHNLFLGQQAVGYAVAKDPWPIKQEKDYANSQGRGIAWWGGIEKVKYNSADFACIQFMNGAAAD